MNLDEARAMIAMAKTLGCKALKVDTFEVQFFPPQELLQDFLPHSLKDPVETAHSEDEVKYWHVGGAGFQDTKGQEVVPPLVGEQPVFIGEQDAD